MRLYALFLASLPAALAAHMRREDGYVGYELHTRGDDPAAAVYQTSNTDTSGGVPLSPIPDVYLNASVSVKEINIEVDNITAKINVDAQVLNLLHFTAGVDASIDRVRLNIQDVVARVELEARLDNVVQMVNDVLDSIDLNPVIASLGKNVGKIINETTGLIGGDNATSNTKRSDSQHILNAGVLYSINDYSGQTHTNRVLAQDGNIYDVKLDNNGHQAGSNHVGTFETSMTFTGHNRTVDVMDGNQSVEYELEYRYDPFPGIEATCWIYTAPDGKVLRTKVVAEATGGGMSTITDQDAEL